MKKFSWNTLAVSVCTLLLGIFILLFFYRPVETEDIGFHLATARWIIEHKAVPWQDPFTFSLPAPRWIFTEWLGSLIYYGAYAVGGFDGLKIFRSLLFGGIFLVFWLYSRRQLPTLLIIILIFVASYGLGGRALLRPFVFNMLFIQAYLWILFRHQKDQGNFLWLLPLLSALWFNIHLGCFVYGLTLVAIFLLGEIINIFNLKNGGAPPVVLKISFEKIRALILVAIGCVVSFFISPYGVAGFVYPIETFFIPENARLLFLNFVQEQRAPGYLIGWSGVWCGILVAWLLTLLGRHKGERFLYLVLFVVPFFLFLHGTRGSDFFVITTICLISELSADLPWARWDQRYKISLGGALLLSVIFSVHIVQWGKERKVIVEKNIVSLSQLTFDPYNNVVGVVEFLKKYNIHGAVFSKELDGGYLLWAGYPQLRVFIDGRKLNADQTDDFIHVFSKPRRYWPWAEREYGFTIVILNVIEKSGEQLAAYLEERPDWQLVLVDGANALFLKKGVFKLPPEALNLSERLQKATLPEIKWPTQPQQVVRSRTPLQAFWQPPPYFVKAHQEGMALFLLGYRAAGLNRVLEARAQDWSTQTQDLYVAMQEEWERSLHRR